MNRYMREKWSWIEGTHGMRQRLLDTLSNADLAFTPGGENKTLGALCRELGEVEHSYTQSLKTGKQDWSYRTTEAGVENNTTQLQTWYQTLDEEMKAIVAALSDEELMNTIDRGGDFSLPAEVQLDVYLQALLIFFGKVSIYLKAMKRPLPEDIEGCIG